MRYKGDDAEVERVRLHWESKMNAARAMVFNLYPASLRLLLGDRNATPACRWWSFIEDTVSSGQSPNLLRVKIFRNDPNRVCLIPVACEAEAATEFCFRPTTPAKSIDGPPVQTTQTWLCSRWMEALVCAVRTISGAIGGPGSTLSPGKYGEIEINGISHEFRPKGHVVKEDPYLLVAMPIPDCGRFWRIWRRRPVRDADD
jgi:hypothetical protein